MLTSIWHHQDLSAWSFPQRPAIEYNGDNILYQKSLKHLTLALQGRWEPLTALLSLLREPLRADLSSLTIKCTQPNHIDDAVIRGILKLQSKTIKRLNLSNISLSLVALRQIAKRCRSLEQLSIPLSAAIVVGSLLGGVLHGLRFCRLKSQITFRRHPQSRFSSTPRKRL